MRLRPDSTVEFYDLVEYAHGEEAVVGRPQAGTYVLVERDGAEVIKRFRKGETYATVRDRYPQYDLEAFVDELRRRGFVRSIDSRRVHDHLRKIKPLLKGLKREHVAWLFSPAAYGTYLALLGFAAYLLVTVPASRPRFEHFFFTDSYLLLILISFLAGIVFVMLHELAHFVAAKSRGVDATFGLVTRYLYLTFITDTTMLYGVEPRKRYRVFAAGMCHDILLGALAIVLVSAAHTGVLPLPAFLVRFLQYLVLLEFFGLVWQGMVFLRTDLYYVLENWFGIYNLHAKAKALVRAPFKKRGWDLLDVPWRERRFVGAYTVLWGLGALALAWLFVSFSIPILVRLFTGAVGNLTAALFLQETRPVLDSIVFLTYFMASQTLYVRSLIKGHKLERSKGFLLTSTLIFLVGNYFLSFFLTILALKYLPGSMAYLATIGVGALLASFVAYLTMRFNEVTHHVVFYTPVIMLVLVVFYPVVLYGLLSVFLNAQPTELAISPLVASIAYGAGIIVALAYALNRWTTQALKH